MQLAGCTYGPTLRECADLPHLSALLTPSAKDLPAHSTLQPEAAFLFLFATGPTKNHGRCATSVLEILSTEYINGSLCQHGGTNPGSE